MSSIELIQKENAELRKIVERHADEINQFKSVLYQLIGGLFNQKTQKNVMNAYIDELYAKDDEEELDEEKVESIWPTTRQGDNNEERISKMEETIQKLEKQIEMLEKRLTGV